jgi:hypothetical protein
LADLATDALTGEAFEGSTNGGLMQWSKPHISTCELCHFFSWGLSQTIFPMSAAVGLRESEGKVGSCTQCQRRDYVAQSLQRDENRYCFVFLKYKDIMCTYPYMSKTSQVGWTILQIAAKDSEFDQVLWTCKESAEDPAGNLSKLPIKCILILTLK